jgi:hypothetical protein
MLMRLSGALPVWLDVKVIASHTFLLEELRYELLDM